MRKLKRFAKFAWLYTTSMFLPTAIVTPRVEAALKEMRSYGEKVLADAVKRAAESGVSSGSSVREVVGERVSDVIVDEATKAGCELIVMGTHGRRGVSRVALGSDAENVLRSSSIPVLLVRSAS